MHTHHAKLQELIENFALFDDWEERYRYLIDLGRNLAPMDDGLKTEERLVKGCTSRVWLDINVEDGIVSFIADSDAHIVRGLIGVLDVAYQGQNVSDIADIDVAGAFDEIGLSQNLSPNRRSGFFSMVERLKNLKA